METIEIKKCRHLRTFILEFILIFFALLICLPDMLYSRWDNALRFFIVYSIVVIVLHIVLAIAYRRWEFPVKLVITEEYIDIYCLFLFFFHRQYHWEKGSIMIEHRHTIGGKISSIAICNKIGRDRVLFESFAITREIIGIILSALERNGYEIDSKVGR